MPRKNIDFTREDAERLKAIELLHGIAHAQLDDIEIKLDSYLALHQRFHSDLDAIVATNTRFRVITVRVLVWVFTTTTGLGLLASGAKAMGWLG